MYKIIFKQGNHTLIKTTKIWQKNKLKGLSTGAFSTAMIGKIMLKLTKKIRW